MCSKIYCQDGIQVYWGTETPQIQEYFGRYALESYPVNDRSYFRMDMFGIWWDKLGTWWIGSHNLKGQPSGYAYYDSDVFCPHMLNEWKWKVIGSGWNWEDAGIRLGVTCKYCDYCCCIIIKTCCNSKCIPYTCIVLCRFM